MDDHVYFNIMSPGSIMWMEEAAAAAAATAMTRRSSTRTSAFLAYANNNFAGAGAGAHNGQNNVHRRMLQFWQKQGDRRKSNNLNKIMAERIRRRTHRHHYQALHLLLPAGTKNDKKSILEASEKEIEELRRQKQQLEKEEVEKMRLLASRGILMPKTTLAEIELKVANSAVPGIDSMLQVLDALKVTGSTPLVIKSSFSDHQFNALLRLETTIKAADVERMVKTTLYEAENKLRAQIKRSQTHTNPNH
ncbi:transcription factor bHLH92 isoform X2 [Andrographis paniculata]|uniref:transcription factor bHLH92 isoform X2 n=1 Tax=Andrographis paniculata TaxID=175694 RepID=UPI0021E831D9|nr:transcription factor bHLH92 isoform X2 [Andrographis paniculata]